MTKNYLDLPEPDSARSVTPVRRLDADDLDIPVPVPSTGSENIWDQLQDALDSSSGADVRVAAATADKTIATGTDVDQNRSEKAHAIELAAQRSYSDSKSPVTHVFIHADKDFDPCGQCLQTLFDHSEEAILQLEDETTDDYREAVLSGSSLFELLEQTPDQKGEATQEPGSEEPSESDDADSLTIPETPPMIDVDIDGDEQVEFVRLNAPIYHLKYRKHHQTFCGTDLSNREWYSSREKPVLMKPCQMCYGESRLRSTQVQKEEIRATLAEQIGEVQPADEEPGVFTNDELIAISEILPVPVPFKTTDDSELRTQLSKAVVDVEASSDGPRSFTPSEMESLVDALDGEGTISTELHLLVCTSAGRIARIGLSKFTQQGRAGRGENGSSLFKSERPIYTLSVNPRDKVYLFTDTGQVYEQEAYRIPVTKFGDSPSLLDEFVDLDAGESVRAAISCSSVLNHDFVVFGTQKGYIKRTNTAEFENILSTGIRAIELEEGDQLQDVCLMNGDRHILVNTKGGQAIRFEDAQVRSMGREARGVKGIEIDEGDEVVAVNIVNPTESIDVFTVTEGGFGKRTPIEKYRKQSRNGRGLVDIDVGHRNDSVADVEMVSEENTYIAMNECGRTIHTAADEVSTVGRNTVGVKIMELDNELLTEVAVLPK